MLTHPSTFGAGWLILVLVASSCIPGSGGGASTLRETRAGSERPKTLTVAVQGEPGNLAIPSMGGVPVGTTGGGDVKLAVHHRLATYDDRGGLHPQLAVELPEQAKGTWTVRADGSMETVYRLRPNVAWHDGSPMSSGDFVLAWTVSRDPDMAISTRLAGQVRRVDTPDALTLVLDWEAPYPLANALVEDEMAPLPRHILEDVYRMDKERFVQLAYWTREFVGVGPYRLAEWEPGSHLVLKAYDAFYGGRAKIDTLIVRFLPDENTVVASLLGGAVDGSLARALDFSQGMVVRREWERAGMRPVFVAQTTHWRLLEVQLRAELARPAEILDVRTRRGLLHAMDRQALVDVLLEGQAPISDTFIPPDDIKWDWVKDVVARYEHDPRRAEQALTSVGWRRGPSGWANAAGERVALSIHTRPGRQAEQEIAIIGDNWRGLGLQVDEVVLSVGDARDARVIATFPGFAPTANPLTFQNTLQVMYGPLCPTERTRWSGRNHGCYQSAEMDQTVDRLRSTIDPEEQRALWRTMARLHSEELPVLPLYFNVQVVIFREGVTGIKGDTKPRTSSMWNVAEWDIA